MTRVPQPHPSRITPFSAHPLVVGVVPGQPELVALTAAELAGALRAKVYFAYVDPGRVTEREFPDGRVWHSDIDPDMSDDDAWRRREAELMDSLANTLDGKQVDWEFRYLAGRPDRSLTHLARAVDASLIVVGTHKPGGGGRVHEMLQRSVGTHLAHHQHRPVMAVPTTVVDWKTPLDSK